MDAVISHNPPMTPKKSIQFLTANWKDLIMCNWRVPTGYLEPYLPKGIALDIWQGSAYMSLVGFRFLNTRVLGIPFPFHVNFDEVNLRFYVTRESGSGLRRGVVFVKEFVPRRCISYLARTLFNEAYFSAEMSSTIERTSNATNIEYQWRVSGQDFAIRIRGRPRYNSMEKGSSEEFIAEHYFGYTELKNGGTLEYEVRHPQWRYAAVEELKLTGNFSALYGPELGKVMESSPDSVQLYDGSEVSVGFGGKI